jgi:hypothetical protein
MNGTTYIRVDVGCSTTDQWRGDASDGSVGDMSTVDGSFLRVEMQDDAGTRYSTDVSTSNELDGGAITDTWAQLTLTVESGSVHIYIDGDDQKTFGAFCQGFE